MCRAHQPSFTRFSLQSFPRELEENARRRERTRRLLAREDFPHAKRKHAHGTGQEPAEAGESDIHAPREAVGERAERARGDASSARRGPAPRPGPRKDRERSAGDGAEGGGGSRPGTGLEAAEAGVRDERYGTREAIELMQIGSGRGGGARSRPGGRRGRRTAGRSRSATRSCGSPA